MSWDGLLGSGVTLTDSPAESARFGVGMSRLTVGWDARPGGPITGDGLMESVAREVTDLLRTDPAEVVVVRYPAESLVLAAAVARSGRQVLAAGSLTYWSAAASEVSGPPPAAGLKVETLSRVTDEADRVAVVDAVVADSFSGYGNHYAANPLLDREAALEGYQEWARRSALSNPDDALVLVLDGRVVGLATLLDSEAPDAHVEVLLAGLTTAAQGQGRYGTLLAGVAQVAGARGRRDVVISTQSHNIRVQRAWARHGLRPFAAVETVHAVRAGAIT
ncbi:GNAT family N-acetyltransferase [Ornithinimicrobium sp. F0845]|uniref:GNAT family N-acetyltransferase n=1 Tax=Ornithinimicrobium sp. F0845 TaxID=2926412 RepID=UPI001FF4F911|nr:GNAT family N-acetyltransferase [Ornithinimicrobium sp. F0845]MCK0113500.1 GNAT family N-acetyltransferase [Ornithinimicrobium sp. F0845]